MSFAPVRRSPSNAPAQRDPQSRRGCSRIETISRICPWVHSSRCGSRGDVTSNSTQLRRQLLFQHAAGLDEEVAIDRFVRYPHVLRVGNSCFSQPEICCGDHCSASFCATRHRSALYSAKRQGLGRNARSWHADQPGLHDRPDCRCCAWSPGLLSMAPVRGPGRSAGSTGPPQCHGKSFAFLKP